VDGARRQEGVVVPLERLHRQGCVVAGRVRNSVPWRRPAARRPADRPGNFFRGRFDLGTVGDTYLDLSGWAKGVVWVNGHNLGRYWEIGPQKRLYCPAPFLLKGRNVIVVFDLHQTKAAAVRGYKTLE